jgi:hypothetical protein
MTKKITALNRKTAGEKPFVVRFRADARDGDIL